MTHWRPTQCKRSMNGHNLCYSSTVSFCFYTHNNTSETDRILEQMRYEPKYLCVCVYVDKKRGNFPTQETPVSILTGKLVQRCLLRKKKKKEKEDIQK